VEGGAAGHQQASLRRLPEERGHGLRGVPRVVDLEAREPPGGQAAHQGGQVPPVAVDEAWMGQNGQPAEAPDEVEGRVLPEPLPLHVGRTSPGEEAVEGLPRGLDVSPREHGLRYVRPAHDLSPRELEDLLLE